MITEERLVEVWSELSTDTKVSLFGGAMEEGYIDCINDFYEMNDFDEIMSNYEPSDIALRIFYGDFRPYDEYFQFDRGTGNLISFPAYQLDDYIDDFQDEIIKFLLDTERFSDYPELDDLTWEIEDPVTDDDLEGLDIPQFLPAANK